MSWKKTLVMAALLGLALAYVFLLEIPRSGKRAQEKDIFSGAGPRQIAGVMITAKEKSFTLKNEKLEAPKKDKDKKEAAASKDWSMPEVPGAEVDQTALNSLLNALTDLKAEETVVEDEIGPDLGVYGLSSPEIALRVSFAGKSEELKEVELAFGKKNEYLNQRYLKVTGLRPNAFDLFLVGEPLFLAANKNRDDFRKRTLLDVQIGDLKAVSIRGLKTEVRFEQAAQEDSAPQAWRIVQPGSYKASESALGELLRQLRALRVKDFIDGDEAAKPQAFGLDKPQAVVRFEFKDEMKKEALEASFVKSSGEKPKDPDDSATAGAYFALGSKPSVFFVESSPLEWMLKPVDEWREKQPFKFAFDQARKAEIKAEGLDDVELIKGADSSWSINGKKADSAFVRQYLMDLSQLKADGFPKAQTDFGFAEPRLRVSLSLASSGVGEASKAEEGEPRLLVVGAPAEREKDGTAKNYFAAAGDLSEPFIISKESFSKIRPKIEVLTASGSAQASGLEATSNAE